MARTASWMRVIEEHHDAERGAWVITYRLATFYWLRPSFWLFLWRTWGVRS